MDCRTFRKHHLAYLDDTLSGEQMAAAQQHVLACDACAAHDTLVRRSLLVVHNLDELEPSADFRARLEARLLACASEAPVFEADGWDVPHATQSRRRRPLMAVAVAGAVVVGALALPSLPERPGGATVRALSAADTARLPAGERLLRSGGRAGLTLADLDAAADDSALAPLSDGSPELESLITPELLQALATGNPMWSMAVLAEDAPLHAVATEVSYQR